VKSFLLKQYPDSPIELPDYDEDDRTQIWRSKTLLALLNIENESISFEGYEDELGIWKKYPKIRELLEQSNEERKTTIWEKNAFERNCKAYIRNSEVVRKMGKLLNERKKLRPKESHGETIKEKYLLYSDNVKTLGIEMGSEKKLLVPPSISHGSQIESFLKTIKNDGKSPIHKGNPYIFKEEQPKYATPTREEIANVLSKKQMEGYDYYHSNFNIFLKQYDKKWVGIKDEKVYVAESKIELLRTLYEKKLVDVYVVQVGVDQEMSQINVITIQNIQNIIRLDPLQVIFFPPI
jgi:hypothetical protein